MTMAMIGGPNFCPGCRARQIGEWVQRQWNENLFPDPRFDPRANPAAGEEVLRSLMFGIPGTVGQMMKPAKFMWEEMGGEPPKRKRKQTKNGKKRRKLMSKNLKICNKRGRKKNGEYKKGWGQSRIMTCAQRMTRKEMNK